MTRVYLAVFKAGLKLKGTPPEDAEAFHRARSVGSFPYDSGDDPSFYWSHTHPGSPVTWGVCRPNVRRGLRRGDIVVFVSFRLSADRQAGEYRVIAAQRVRMTLTHTGIFRFPANETFRAYPNHLIRPCGNGWEHYEPVLPANDWHSDWLARISKLRGVPIEHFKEAGAAHRAGSELTVRGAQIEAASNYVIFETEPHGFVLHSPPLVATWQHGDIVETWCSDIRSQSVRQLTIGRFAPTRTLRVDNQIAHPHIKGEFNEANEKWLETFREVCMERRINGLTRACN